MFPQRTWALHAIRIANKCAGRWYCLHKIATCVACICKSTFYWSLVAYAGQIQSPESFIYLENIICRFLPAGATSRLQRINDGLISILKSKCRSLLISELIEALLLISDKIRSVRQQQVGSGLESVREGRYSPVGDAIRIDKIEWVLL